MVSASAAMKNVVGRTPGGFAVAGSFIEPLSDVVVPRLGDSGASSCTGGGERLFVCRLQCAAVVALESAAAYLLVPRLV